MILLFFFEVRNAYAAVFMVVVGTVLELLLRRPKGLCEILQPLLHTLSHISIQPVDETTAKKRTFVSTNCHFSPTWAASKLHISRRTSM
jgi:hypothetical protein